MRTVTSIATGLVTALCLSGCLAAAPAGGSSRPPRQVIHNTGSDTMLNLALAWAEGYRAVAPEVEVVVTGGGSGTGIAGLLNGTVDIANASRSLKDNEIADARRAGFEPIEHQVAIDALAVIVHRSNPVARLTIAQLADIYAGRFRNWREVGGKDAPIVPVSRESNSGTHVYFLERVVRRGDKANHDIFAPHALLMPSSVGIASEVTRNPNAIGYDGLGYVSEETERIVAIGETVDGPFVIPSAASAADGSYPLARPLFMDTHADPTEAVATYLAWLVGPGGQALVTELGFVPIGTR
jgi:phosphate transport system substrate-binding protein